MHICFFDESNTPPKPGKKNPRPYFVIAGVFIPVAQWHAIAGELKKLKSSLNVKGEIKWRFFGKENNDKDNSVKHLDEAQRKDFREKYYRIITSRKSMKIVASIANIEACYKEDHIKDEHDLYKCTYKPLTERFQYYLQDLSRISGEENLGIIVGDHRGRDDDERLRKAHKDLLSSDTRHTSSYENIIETVFLSPSHYSVGIQFADMVAGAIGRAFNSDDDYWRQHINPAIRTHPDGRSQWGYGLVKVPRNW